MRASVCPASNCSMRALTLAAMTSLAVCGLGCGWLHGGGGGVACSWVLPPCALAVAFHAMRGMYLHAERLLAKAGVARRKGRGISHPWSGAKRSGKGEAQRRSAQAKRGRLGRPLAPRDGAAPLSEVWLPYSCASAHRLSGSALRAGTRLLQNSVQEICQKGKIAIGNTLRI